MYLTGRTSELDRIRSVIGASKESALSIVARRGAGKSALLSQIPRLSDYRTVFLQANAAEADWPFSGLTALLNGIDDPILSRFTDQLLRTSTADMNVSTVSTMLLDGLHKRSSGRTVIVVDDADQLDPSTQAVLGFLSRRLAGTDIALFTSVREQGPGSPFHSIPALHLSALDYMDTVRILESFPARQTATAAIHAVAAASQGNLAAAVELYTGLLERQAEGTWAFPIPLACRSSFDSEYATAVGSLGAAARQVLNLLSLSRRSDIATLEKVCGELWPGLDELLGNGLASQSGPHVRIPDQLLRGYVYSAMPPAARTAGHRTLAEAAGADDPYAQRWHQSFSAPERETPLGLLRFAVDLIRTGEVPFALEYIERALTVGPCGAESAVRLTTAAELLFNRGEFVFARRYLEWAQRVTCNPALVLRLAGLGFELQFMQGTSVRPSMVLRLVKEFGQHDPAYSARLLAVGSLYYAERWELDDALTLLQHVQEFRDAASSDCLAMADCAARLVDAIRGKSVHLPRTREAAGTTLATVLVEGRALTYAEHHGAAHEAHAIVRSSGEAVDVNWRQTAAHFAVDNEIRAGNVRRAILLIDRLEHSDPETKYHRGMRHIFRVWRAHSLGDEALAQRFFAEAQHFVSEASHPAVTAQLAACQGQFALMRGDLAEAFAQLSRAAEIGTVFANPTLLRSEADLVEVLIRLGRHSEAIRVFGRLESRSIGRRSSWLMTATARSRAMLSDGEESLRLFNAALESSGSQESLLERARTLLCYAERLSAFGRLGEGREGLLQAKVLFDECGADAWTQRVDSLLLDERIRPAGVPANPAMLMLTDHERSLAQMVARGMRNKEIAGTLFVSVRTVEVRLTSIYRKLGVESRAQLSALASGKMAATREPYVLPLL